MRVLLTDSRGSLGTALVKWLAQHHEVRTLDPAADLRDRDTASRSVQDCDMIIHSMTTVLPGMAPLDALDTASRATFNLITQAASASRFILLSSLRILEQYDVKWHVTEAWAPKPTTAVDNLAPYLAELTVREASRVLPIRAIALRLGDVVEDADMKDCPASSRWLHINDAVQAVERALGFEPTPRDPRTGWWVFHIPGGGPRTRFPLAEAGEQPFNYAPRHDVTSSVPLPLTPSPTSVSISRQRPAERGERRRVLILGAGGPLGASAAAAMAHDHVLRLADVRALADIIAENGRRFRERRCPVYSKCLTRCGSST